MESDLSLRIAQRAFQRSKSWDALVIGWLRPIPALAILALVFLLSSYLWMVPDASRNAYSEYEAWMDEVDRVNLDTRISQLQSDSELVVWLEQEGHSQ
jgi:hypothetical protein